jgi:hypothetical protein
MDRAALRAGLGGREGVVWTYAKHVSLQLRGLEKEDSPVTAVPDHHLVLPLSLNFLEPSLLRRATHRTEILARESEYNIRVEWLVRVNGVGKHVVCGLEKVRLDGEELVRCGKGARVRGWSDRFRGSRALSVCPFPVEESWLTGSRAFLNLGEMRGPLHHSGGPDLRRLIVPLLRLFPARHSRRNVEIRPSVRSQRESTTDRSGVQRGQSGRGDEDEQHYGRGDERGEEE